ncbi:MAG: histidinol-phosphate transaminase [Candidatus Nanopelagicales bacterium]
MSRGPVPATPAILPGEPLLALRPELAGRHPYGAPQLDVAARLNVNENPYPPSPELAAALGEAIAEAAVTLHRYPDRDALGLRAELAAYLRRDCPAASSLGDGNVWAANGSNEIMLQLLQAFGGPGRVALSFAPTYSMYPEYCVDTFTEYRVVPREPDFTLTTARVLGAIAEHRPAVVLLASPNNPTGTSLPLELVERVCAAAPGIVVVDEAYAEFRRPGTASALELLAGNPRLVVTRTMSKAFAFAGARLGYLAASPAVVEAVQLVRLPYHLSTLTQVAALTALAHSAELLARVADLRAARDELAVWLSAQGYEVAQSDANFVLFGRFADREEVFRGLLGRGVLIRVTGPEGWLRVSVGTPAELELFRAALREVGASASRSA